MKTRAKDVLPNVHRMQTAVSGHSRHPVTLPAAAKWFGLVLDDVICSVRRMAHASHALQMGMTQQFFGFRPR